jgi:hypothetical protein
MSFRFKGENAKPLCLTFGRIRIGVFELDYAVSK